MPVANIASAPCQSSVERPNAVTLKASHVNDTETSRARPSVTLNDETSGVATTAPMPNAAVSSPRPAAPAPNTLSANTALSCSIGFARNATAKTSMMAMRMPS